MISGIRNEVVRTRILVLPSWYPPAGGGFFRDHAEALSGKEFEVHVVVNRMMGISTTSIKTILISLGKRTRYENNLLVQRKGFIKLPLMERISVMWWIRSYTRQINSYIHEYGYPDIIIAHSAIWAGIPAVKTALSFNIPLILVEHRSRFVTGHPISERYFKKWHFPLLRKVYSGATTIVTVSKALCGKIIEIESCAERKMKVIPNLVNTDFYFPSGIKKDFGKFTFITIAMLEEVKGIRFLLEAFQRCEKVISRDMELLIAGKGSLESSLRIYAKELQIEDKVKFLGYLSADNIRKALRKSDVFVLPSIIEAFGVSVVEAMSIGLPVIVTRSGGPESIVTEVTGITVPSGDPEKLSIAMEQMVNNYGAWDRRKIRDYAVMKFSAESISQQWRELIKQTIYAQNRIKK